MRYCHRKLPTVVSTGRYIDTKIRSVSIVDKGPEKVSEQKIETRKQLLIIFHSHRVFLLKVCTMVTHHNKEFYFKFKIKTKAFNKTQTLNTLNL